MQPRRMLLQLPKQPMFINFMKKTILAIVGIFIALAFCACGPTQTAHRHHHHQTKSLAVRHLPDGRYAYQDDSGIWWFYMYHMMTTSSTPSVYTRNNVAYNYYTSVTPPPALPANGAWVPEKEIITEPHQVEQLEFQLNDPRTPIVEEQVEVTEQGQIETPESEQMEFNFDNSPDNPSDSPETSPDTPSSNDSSSTPDSSPSDSGSSDSGSSDTGSSGGESSPGGETI